MSGNPVTGYPVEQEGYVQSPAFKFSPTAKGLIQEAEKAAEPGLEAIAEGQGERVALSLIKQEEEGVTKEIVEEALVTGAEEVGELGAEEASLLLSGAAEASTVAGAPLALINLSIAGISFAAGTVATVFSLAKILRPLLSHRGSIDAINMPLLEANNHVPPPNYVPNPLTTVSTIPFHLPALSPQFTKASAPGLPDDPPEDDDDDGFDDMLCDGNTGGGGYSGGGGGGGAPGEDYQGGGSGSAQGSSGGSGTGAEKGGGSAGAPGGDKPPNFGGMQDEPETLATPLPTEEELERINAITTEALKSGKVPNMDGESARVVMFVKQYLGHIPNASPELREMIDTNFYEVSNSNKEIIENHEKANEQNMKDSFDAKSKGKNAGAFALSNADPFTTPEVMQNVSDSLEERLQVKRNVPIKNANKYLGHSAPVKTAQAGEVPIVDDPDLSFADLGNETTSTPPEVAVAPQIVKTADAQGFSEEETEDAITASRLQQLAPHPNDSEVSANQTMNEINNSDTSSTVVASGTPPDEPEGEDPEEEQNVPKDWDKEREDLIKSVFESEKEKLESGEITKKEFAKRVSNKVRNLRRFTEDQFTRDRDKAAVESTWGKKGKLRTGASENLKKKLTQEEKNAAAKKWEKQQEERYKKQQTKGLREAKKRYKESRFGTKAINAARGFFKYTKVSIRRRAVEVSEGVKPVKPLTQEEKVISEVYGFDKEAEEIIGSTTEALQKIQKSPVLSEELKTTIENSKIEYQRQYVKEANQKLKGAENYNKYKRQMRRFLRRRARSERRAYLGKKIVQTPEQLRSWLTMQRLNALKTGNWIKGQSFKLSALGEKLSQIALKGEEDESILQAVKRKATNLVRGVEAIGIAKSSPRQLLEKTKFEGVPTEESEQTNVQKKALKFKKQTEADSEKIVNIAKKQLGNVEKLQAKQREDFIDHAKTKTGTRIQKARVKELSKRVGKGKISTFDALLGEKSELVQYKKTKAYEQKLELVSSFAKETEKLIKQRQASNIKVVTSKSVEELLLPKVKAAKEELIVLEAIGRQKYKTVPEETLRGYIERRQKYIREYGDFLKRKRILKQREAEWLKRREALRVKKLAPPVPTTPKPEPPKAPESAQAAKPPPPPVPSREGRMAVPEIKPKPPAPPIPSRANRGPVPIIKEEPPAVVPPAESLQDVEEYASEDIYAKEIFEKPLPPTAKLTEMQSPQNILDTAEQEIALQQQQQQAFTEAVQQQASQDIADVKGIEENVEKEAIKAKEKAEEVLNKPIKKEVEKIKKKEVKSIKKFIKKQEKADIKKYLKETIADPTAMSSVTRKRLRRAGLIAAGVGIAGAGAVGVGVGIGVGIYAPGVALAVGKKALDVGLYLGKKGLETGWLVGKKGLELTYKANKAFYWDPGYYVGKKIGQAIKEKRERKKPHPTPPGPTPPGPGPKPPGPPRPPKPEPDPDPFIPEPIKPEVLVKHHHKHLASDKFMKDINRQLSMNGAWGF